MARRICKITSFHCLDCSNYFEGIYRYGENSEVRCRFCSSTNTELKAQPKRNKVHLSIIGASDWNKEEFNHGLGEVTRGIRDAERKARDRGLVAIGNENLDRFNHYQDQRFEKDVDETIEKSFEEGLFHLKEELRRAR